MNMKRNLGVEKRMDHVRLAVIMLLLVPLPLLYFSPSIRAESALTSSTFVYTGQFPFQGGPGCGVFIDYFAANEGRSVHIVFSSSVATDVYIANSSQYFEYNENATSHPCPPVGLFKIGTGVTNLSTDFVPPSTDMYYVWFGYQPARSTMPSFSIEFNGFPASITMSKSLRISSASTLVVASNVTSQFNQTGPILRILIAVLLCVLIAVALVGYRRAKRPKRKRRRVKTRQT
jgi:hypothetical protein